VSTKEALQAIREAKQEVSAKAAAKATTNAAPGGFALSCEAMPHHLCLTEEDANRLGAKSFGKVSPPLRSEEDRQALIRSLGDGTVDAIATDHAPHSAAYKEAGSPGFSGFETAFAALYTALVRAGDSGASSGANSGANIDLRCLSSLLSANPARLLGFGNSKKRARLLPGCAADLVMIDTEAAWIVESEKFLSRGKNSAFAGRKLFGKILMTLHSGRLVFQNYAD
jgi:dihydroorotase